MGFLGTIGVKLILFEMCISTKKYQPKEDIFC
jgi:hypothetical protein